jgi:YVTN family beta-propeller protein
MKKLWTWIPPVAIGLLLVGGWIYANTVHPMHLRHVTGRSDVGGINCLHCHLPVSAPATWTEIARDVRYISPAGLAVSPDGGRLYVTSAGTDRLLEVDLATNAITRSVEIAGAPHGVAVSADGSRIAVSARYADTVVVLDAPSLETVDSVAALEPLGVVLSRTAERLFVAGAFNDLLVIDDRDSSAPPPTRLAMGNEPYALALARDERLLVVANRLAAPGSPHAIPSSELTFVDPETRRVTDRRQLESAHLSEGVALSSDGSFALASIVRARNLLPLTSTLAFIETKPGGRTLQFPLDEVNAYFADPTGVALTPDDRIAFIAHSGARVVTAVDVAALREVIAHSTDGELVDIADDLGAASRYVLTRIPTAHAPRAVCLSPDGGRLYVAERLADSIAVIDTALLRIIKRIDLGGPEELTAERRGERVFHDASGTFQGQFSCRSCHPDGHTDGLTWDFEIDGIGQNILETRSLRGVRDTAPFKWNGKNASLKMQCGPRFARVLTRSDPFEPQRLDDLVAYIESIPLPPRREPNGTAVARERGERIFFRSETSNGETLPMVRRCQTCHRPPLFTDRLPADVGTGGRFDTPHLFAVGSSGPYLHDGRSRTLEEIWTVHSPQDTHGATNDLTKAQLNDLVIYLRSL